MCWRCILLPFLCLLLLVTTAYPCTILSLTDGERILIGNNEDYDVPFTAIEIIPASADEYGRICFGFNTGDGSVATTGGINDRGLFIDGNGIDATDWAPVEGLPDFGGIVEAHVLASFATVSEVLEWFRSTNVRILARAKFLVADRSGTSAIVEWSGGELKIIPRDGRFQISTNFRTSEHSPDEAPCYRYRTAEAMLNKADGASVDLVRQVLAATHFESPGSTTLFSYVSDLDSGLVYIYNFHHFEDVVVLDLNEELRRGHRFATLPSLFDRLPYAQVAGAPYLMSDMIGRIFQRDGTDGLDADLAEMRELSQATYGRDYTESIVNALGYSLLRERRFGEAVEIFRFNVDLYPESANVYDSLGEACLAAGDTLRAIENYRKSLEMDPGNGNARAVLDRID